MKNIVYLLGAGSSKCANAPLINEFRQQSQEICNEPEDHWKADDPNREAKIELFRKTLSHWDKVHWFNIEEFYVLADVHERLDLTKLHIRTHDFSLAQGVSYLIFKTLDRKMGKKPSDHHRKFFGILKNEISKGRDSSIITLNWDIALDNVVRKNHIRMNVGYEKFASDHSVNEEHQHSFPLLKVHGSADWWFCTNKQCLFLFVDQKGGKSVARQHLWGPLPRPCSECHQEKLLPAIIPPVSQKLERDEGLNPLFAPIWKMAKEKLGDCDELVIVGYSFPPTDVQFKTFVVDSLMQNNKLSKILVVSNHKDPSSKYQFELFYRSLVEKHANTVTLDFDYDGFEQWVEKTLSRLESNEHAREKVNSPTTI